MATLRALRHHGGKADFDRPAPEAVKAGLANLGKHIENVRTLGIRPVVALNLFEGDGNEEVRLVSSFCAGEGVPFAKTTAYSEGGEGSRLLAELVVEEAVGEGRCVPVYQMDDPIKEKVDKVVKKMYGGSGVAYSGTAKSELERIVRLGYQGLPICIAKTSNSLSDDAKLVGRPVGFVATVHDVELAAGAGYVIVEMGEISRMPGLPSVPDAERISLSDDGVISGVV